MAQNRPEGEEWRASDVSGEAREFKVLEHEGVVVGEAGPVRVRLRVGPSGPFELYFPGAPREPESPEPAPEAKSPEPAPELDDTYFDEVRHAVGTGTPTILLGTSTRALERSLQKLKAVQQAAIERRSAADLTEILRASVAAAKTAPTQHPEKD